MTIVNNRREPRYPVQIPIRTEEGDGIEERIIDLSLCGCKINTPAIMRVGRVMVLGFMAPEKDKTPPIENTKVTKIVWRKEADNGFCEYGLKFICDLNENRLMPAVMPQFHIKKNWNTLRLIFAALVVMLSFFSYIRYHRLAAEEKTRQDLLLVARNAEEKQRSAARQQELSLIAKESPVKAISRPKIKVAFRKPLPEIYKPSLKVLSVESFAASYQNSLIRTRIALLDILAALFISCRSDKGLLNGDTLAVSGKDIEMFLKAHGTDYPGDETDGSIIKQISFHSCRDVFCFEALFKEKGEQAIPGGFGTKVRYEDRITGRISSETRDFSPAGKIHLLVLIDDPKGIYFVGTTFSSLKGVRSMKVVAAELIASGQSGAPSVIGILYGRRDNGGYMAVRSDVRSPSISFIKAIKLEPGIIACKQEMENNIPDNLLN